MPVTGISKFTDSKVWRTEVRLELETQLRSRLYCDIPGSHGLQSLL